MDYILFIGLRGNAILKYFSRMVFLLYVLGVIICGMSNKRQVQELYVIWDIIRGE